MRPSLSLSQTIQTSLRVLLASAWLACLATSAADWPQWLGPQRNGHSPETGLLQQWPTQGPKLLWHTQTLGGGYGSAAIAGDRLYVIGNNSLTNEFVLALSTTDGRQLWSARLGNVGRPDQNPNYPAARSTPTLDGPNLYALGSDGDLVCLESGTGRERWRKNLRTDFGGKCGEWAYSESPLVDGDILVCTPGGADATLVALNKSTGSLVWKCPMPDADDAAYASVVVGSFSGVKQYLQFLPKGLAGVDAATGKLLWRYERNAKGSPAVVMTPLVSGDTTYAGAYRAGGALVKPIKQNTGFTAEEVYFSAKLPYGLGGVVKVGDLFYGTGSESILCVQYPTGDVKWQQRSSGVAWLVADGRLYGHTEEGDVILVEPTGDAYRELGRFTPPDRPANRGQSKAWAFPALANGRLYVRELGSLWCFDVRAAR